MKWGYLQVKPLTLTGCRVGHVIVKRTEDEKRMHVSIIEFKECYLSG